MSHLRTYKIFPDNWAKDWSTRDLNNARLALKSYVTNKETELGIREVSNLIIFKMDLFWRARKADAMGPCPKKGF